MRTSERRSVTACPTLISLATAVPPHVERQADIRKLAGYLFADALAADAGLIEVFANSQIETRHLCAPLELFSREMDFGERNDLYVEHAVELSEEVTRRSLARVNLTPQDIDHVIFVSSTGLATPSLDARLANALDFRPDVRRTPLWGLGCAGGAAGLSRARDFALADPSSTVLLVALELCSLTFQRNDMSKRNLVAASLFADGAAAAIVVGSRARGASANGHRPLEILASRSTLWKDTLDVMGWTVDGDGLHVVFSRDIPAIVQERVKPSLTAFLSACGLELDDVRHLVAHPGGAKVLAAYSEALGLPPAAFRHSRDVLRDYGNMSSPSCLFVLERFLDSHEIGAGDNAILAALGPGFSAEYVLLRGGTG